MPKPRRTLRYKGFKRWSLGAITLVASSSLAQSQWVPISARIAESRTTTHADGSTRREVIEGLFFRSSSGNQTERTKIAEGGRVIVDVATIVDNAKLRGYEIDYIKKSVREIEKFKSPRRPELSTVHDGKPVPEAVVDGLKCYVFPVIAGGKDVGKAWISKDYLVTIKSDYVIPGKGEQTHIENHMLDIRAGHEPDGKVFLIDPSFRVLEPGRPPGDLGHQ